MPLEKRILCYITDRAPFNSSNVADILAGKIRSAVAAGVDWVQVRERDLPARELLTLTRQAIQLFTHVRVIVNDRLDVALATGAAGVHLGGESLPAEETVRWCRSGKAPDSFLIGVSCHSLKDACEAEAAGASYVAFGPVFDTPSKRRFGKPQGIAMLAEVCRGVKVPVIAIGGVNEQNGEECLSAGASGIAAIRLFQDVTDPESLRRWGKRVRQLT